MKTELHDKIRSILNDVIFLKDDIEQIADEDQGCESDLWNAAGDMSDVIDNLRSALNNCGKA